MHQLEPMSEGFGIYRAIAEIGYGASGVVFSGDYGRLKRPVAIKVLHRHLIGEEWATRMLEEAKTISLLDHPGIVKVFDVGVSADGRPFVVMEYLDGEPLSARLDGARLMEEYVVLFARQLASALEVAHAAGVVHRDLKPENVFIVRDPDISGGERVKLIDFGIAKRSGREYTATGVVLGTPAYMAPEQALGSRDVDMRADIYSLGVIIYLMATGTPPFAGRDTSEMQAEHAFCAPPPAATTAGVSAELSAIIDRCLAKRPGDRFATMAELGAALRQLELANAELEAATSLDDLRTLVRRPSDQMKMVLSGTPSKFGAEPMASFPLPSPPPPSRPLLPARPLEASEPSSSSRGPDLLPVASTPTPTPTPPPPPPSAPHPFFDVATPWTGLDTSKVAPLAAAPLPRPRRWTLLLDVALVALSIALLYSISPTPRSFAAGSLPSKAVPSSESQPWSSSKFQHVPSSEVHTTPPSEPQPASSVEPRAPATPQVQELPDHARPASRRSTAKRVREPTSPASKAARLRHHEQARR